MRFSTNQLRKRSSGAHVLCLCYPKSILLMFANLCKGPASAAVSHGMGLCFPKWTSPEFANRHPRNLVP
ncbi:unnamed protein product [Dicrocoelium dendriticum]|nr:unnamed protein product [Dicrocoelium dendriticum]